MRYTRLFGLFILLFAAACMIACSGRNNDHSGMTLWASNNPEEIAFARQCVDSWNAANTSYPVAMQPIPEGQSSEEVILAAVVGKTTPDIYANMWQGEVEDYARAGVLVALDTVGDFKEFLLRRCSNKVIEEITASDGHIYQVPWKVNPIIMLFNKGILAEQGVDSVPVTYSEFLAAGDKITTDRDGDGYYDLWLGTTEVSPIWWQRLFNFVPLYYAASGGGAIVRNERAAFDNAQGVEVFRFLQEIYRRGYFPKEQMRGQSDPFLARKIAIRFTGPWAIQQINTYKAEDLDYGFAPMPVPDDHAGPVYTYCDPKNIVVFNTCRDPARAVDLIKTMISAEADYEFLKISNQLPRRSDLLTNEMFKEYFDKNPGMKPFAMQSQYLKGTDSSPNMKEVLDLISQEYEACVVFGRKTPEDAIRDAAKAVNLLYMK